MKLHELIEKERKKLNITQQDMASLLGWSRAKYNKMESGKQITMTPSDVVRILKLLNLRVQVSSQPVDL